MPEIVVVGGGVIGASAGYTLARAGASVTLVDREDPGTATNAAAGIISALDDNPPNEEWSGYAFPAMRYYRELAAELEELGEKDHSLRVLGELKLSAAADPEKDLKAKLAQRQGVIDSFGSEGIGSNVLIGAAEIREISGSTWVFESGSWARNCLIAVCHVAASRRLPLRSPISSSTWISRVRAALHVSVTGERDEGLPEHDDDGTGSPRNNGSSANGGLRTWRRSPSTATGMPWRPRCHWARTP